MNAQGPNRILDEFAKLMTDAAGVAQGVQREAETAIRSQADHFLAKMDLVQREDFEIVREMASRAREENQAMEARVEALEARLEVLEGAKKPAKSRARPKK